MLAGVFVCLDATDIHPGDAHKISVSASHTCPFRWPDCGDETDV